MPRHHNTEERSDCTAVNSKNRAVLIHLGRKRAKYGAYSNTVLYLDTVQHKPVGGV